MNINFNAAISAYKNASNYVTMPVDNADISGVNVSQSNAFATLVEQPLGNSINTLHDAERTAIGNLTKQADITDVVTAITQAESTLKTVVAVRDRLITAFQDLEKMPI